MHHFDRCSSPAFTKIGQNFYLGKSGALHRELQIKLSRIANWAQSLVCLENCLLLARKPSDSEALVLPIKPGELVSAFAVFPFDSDSWSKIVSVWIPNDFPKASIMCLFAFARGMSVRIFQFLFYFCRVLLSSPEPPCACYCLGLCIHPLHWLPVGMLLSVRFVQSRYRFLLHQPRIHPTPLE